jgi:type I restriction enzyme M protein
VLAWWNAHEEGPQAWRVTAESILANGCNLDLKNPHAKASLTHADPKELVASLRAHEQAVMQLLNEIKTLVSQK